LIDFQTPSAVYAFLRPEVSTIPKVHWTRSLQSDQHDNHWTNDSFSQNIRIRTTQVLIEWTVGIAAMQCRTLHFWLFLSPRHVTLYTAGVDNILSDNTTTT